MRLSFILINILIVAFCGFAQSLRLEKDVELLSKNIYGARNPRTDVKGRICGVLMLHSSINGVIFKGPVIEDVVYESGVYYVYLEPNSKKLEIIDPSGAKMSIVLPDIQSKATYQATVYHTNGRGSLVATSDPSGANVTLISAADRISLGKTPLKGNVEVLEGVYSVEVSKPGFESYVKKNVKISAGKTTKLGSFKLTKSKDNPIESKDISASLSQDEKRDEPLSEMLLADKESKKLSADVSHVSHDKVENQVQDLSGIRNLDFLEVDKLPEFPGGTIALMKWIEQNLVYPYVAKRDGIQGRVMVKFIVDKYGNIANPKITKGVHPELDREALRLVMSMPKWIAGRLNGNPVASYYTLPVNFRIAE